MGDGTESEPSTFPNSERASYGFALYLGSYALLVLFLMWAFLPNEWLATIGFTYYPQKYWAIAVPVYCCVSLAMIFILYIAGNCLMVVGPDDLRNITDSHTLFPRPLDSKLSVPPLYDIPITVINRALFDSYTSLNMLS